MKPDWKFPPDLSAGRDEVALNFIAEGRRADGDWHLTHRIWHGGHRGGAAGRTSPRGWIRQGGWDGGVAGRNFVEGREPPK